MKMYFLIFFRCASVVWVVVHVDGPAALGPPQCTVLHFVHFLSGHVNLEHNRPFNLHPEK